MSGLELILSRVEFVQRSGKGYRSACPACGGRSRKLSLTESDDGRVLLHCFGGCDAATVVQAAGLQLGDLFPERLAADTPDERRRRQRLAREAQWGAALDALDFEATVVLIAGTQMQSGVPLNDDDKIRLSEAIDRIHGARQLLRDAPRYKPSVGAAA